MHADPQEQYLSEFGEILVYLLVATVFILITLLVSKLIRPNRPNAEKLSTYESGEEPISSPWTQFNVRFYVVALIFLLFEVEIVFLFPWATVFAKKELIEETNGLWGWFSMLEMLLFILILALGLAYAWVNGFLDWIRPNPTPTEIISPVPRDLYDKINQKYSASLDEKSEQNKPVENK
jgi:NADH-quinone oxidoreductase subunit A